MACQSRLRLGPQTVFPDPLESLKSNSITRHPHKQSLFVYYLAFETAVQMCPVHLYC